LYESKVDGITSCTPLEAAFIKTYQCHCYCGRRQNAKVVIRIGLCNQVNCILSCRRCLHGQLSDDKNHDHIVQ